jgi:hypothetical protein
MSFVILYIGWKLNIEHYIFNTLFFYGQSTSNSCRNLIWPLAASVQFSAINNSYIGEGDSKRKVGATLYWPRRWRQRLRQKRGMRQNHHSSPGPQRLCDRHLSDSLSPRSRSPRSSRSPMGRSRGRISMRDDINHSDYEPRSRTGLRDKLALVAVPRRSRLSSLSPERSYDRRLSSMYFWQFFFQFLSLCKWHVQLKYIVSFESQNYFTVLI